MNWRDAWDHLVNGYNFQEEVATDVLNAAGWACVLEISVRYTDTVTLLVRRVGYNDFVVDETDA